MKKKYPKINGKLGGFRVDQEDMPWKARLLHLIWGAETTYGGFYNPRGY